MKSFNSKLTSFKDAKKIMFNSIKINKTEFINLEKAENRILAQDVFSKSDIPEYDNSAVDGFGFINSKLNKKNLEVIGESKPGKPFLKKIKKNQAIKVYTGAYVIREITNIDTVSMEEDVIYDGKFVTINNKSKTGTNIRVRGEDVKKSKKIFNKGTKIRIVDLAQLSSIGLKKIKVYKKIKVGIFSTGDELCELNKKKSKYQIYDSNKLVLCSLFSKIGCDIVDLGIIKDDSEETNKKILKSLKLIDVLVTSGGVSKSNTDKISKFLKENCKISFWQLSIKPGRPFAFGHINKTPFICLPGNPVATVVTFFVLVVNYINKLSGYVEKSKKDIFLPCDFDLKKKKGRTEWLRGKIIKKKQTLLLSKFNSTGSGIISSISQSDGIIELEEQKHYIAKGTLLKFLKFEDLLN